MQPRLRNYGLAILASAAFVAIPAILAQAAECQATDNWSQDRLAKFDVALAKAEQDGQAPASQLNQAPSEVDAAIASLEQDIATRKGDAAAKGEAALKELRASRDAYRAAPKRSAHPIIRAAGAAEARQSSEEATPAFWTKVNAYLDAVDADVATRQAAMQTRFIGN